MLQSHPHGLPLSSKSTIRLSLTASELLLTRAASAMERLSASGVNSGPFCSAAGGGSLRGLPDGVPRFPLAPSETGRASPQPFFLQGPRWPGSGAPASPQADQLRDPCRLRLHPPRPGRTAHRLRALADRCRPCPNPRGGAFRYASGKGWSMALDTTIIDEE